MANGRPALIAAVSDTHVNSTVGLCPPEGVRLGAAGTYMPGHHQLWSWQCWEEFWHDTDEVRRQTGARLILLVDGDSQDADHHDTAEIISKNMETQAQLVERVYEIPKRLKPDKVFMVLGTEAHGGSTYDAALGRYLRSDRDPITREWGSQHIRFEANGKLVDARHAGRTGMRPWTEGSALANLAFHIWVEHARRNERAPDLAFRAHKHCSGDSGPGQHTRVIALPAWQTKTVWAHGKVPETLESLGGVLTLIAPDGKIEVIPKLYPLALPPVRKA